CQQDGNWPQLTF
nr:immunoglobulin light chain junction region [Macaca mulatta]MPN99805.1 immunoglobulin light chain junction region [Macaca mulatta]